MLETYYTIRIGSTPTFLYFDLYLYSAYAAHYVYYREQSRVSCVYLGRLTYDTVGVCSFVMVCDRFTLFSCRQIIDNVLLEPAEFSSPLALSDIRDSIDPRLYRQ